MKKGEAAVGNIVRYIGPEGKYRGVEFKVSKVMEGLVELEWTKADGSRNTKAELVYVRLGTMPAQWWVVMR